MKTLSSFFFYSFNLYFWGHIVQKHGNGGQYITALSLLATQLPFYWLVAMLASALIKIVLLETAENASDGIVVLLTALKLEWSRVVKISLQAMFYPKI